MDNGDGTFAVSAAVNYHHSGDYPLTVTVTDPSGIQAQLHGFAHVTPGPNETYVSQAYVDLLGRTPDRDGLAFWVTSLNTGTPRPEVADFLTHSAEYFATNVIQPAYLQFLGRAADAFLHSPEAETNLVDRCYADYLGRPGDPAGVEAWLAALQTDRLSWAELAEAFLASDEFFARATQLS